MLNPGGNRVSSPPLPFSCSLFSEGLAIQMLAWLALSSVSEEDARVASGAVSEHLTKLARPQLLAELRAHQARARERVDMEQGEKSRRMARGAI